MICQSEDLPAHVVPIAWSVREAMREFNGQFNPDDLIMINDPYLGGTHLNDVALIYPVYDHGELYILPCIRIHWADIGGMTPGSLTGTATDIYQEGIRIPPIKIAEGGNFNRAAMQLLFSNVRLPDQTRGDLRATVATCKTAERRIGKLVAHYGRETIQRAIELNFERTERRMRNSIARMPKGDFLYEDFAEYYWEGELDPVRIALKLTIGDNSITADFEGSSPQMPGPVNQSLANTECGVFVVVKSITDPAGMNNHGALQPITVRAPAASIVNLQLPAPAGAASEARKRVIAAMLGALSQAVPDLVAGDGVGASNHNMIGSHDPRKRRDFIDYEYPCGGTGAFRGGDGANAIPTYDQGETTMVQPAEMLEATYPVLIESTELRVGSGGAGQWRGGLGIRRRKRLLAPSGTYSLLSDRAVLPPFGIAGGKSAACNRFVIERDGEILPFTTPGKISGFPMILGDILIMESAGGGGFGNPVDRDPGEVLEDVLDGYVTLTEATEVYGVVLTPAGVVDHEATTARRRLMTEALVWGRVVESKGELYEGKRGTHRICPLSATLADRVGVGEGDLLAIYGRSGAPIRGWVVIMSTLEVDQAPLDPFAMKVLNVVREDMVRLEKVAPGIRRAG
jgi:N-methylhydantoinase B